MKRETTWGRGCDRWDHEHEVRGRSLTLGIRYHGHGCHGKVVESMDVIGHGMESPWGGLVKFFQCDWHVEGTLQEMVEVLDLALHLNYELNGRQNHGNKV